jgi:cystathionine beta-synthase
VTDPRDIPSGARSNGTDTKTKRRQFIEITMDTPLSVLNRFFEWNSAAVVTEKDESGAMKPLAVVTKVDLLTWMLHQTKADCA